MKRGLQWRDAPSEYGPHKTLYNRFVRGSEGAYLTVYFLGLPGPKMFKVSSKLIRHTLMLTSQQPACCSLGKFIPQIQALKRQKGDVFRRIGQTKGDLNSKRHAVCDGHGHPVVMLLAEGQMSDYTGAQ
ncbi:MAG: transposase [Magnetovibrio sp.]|nr:transposase [Magnetovibrio sp.]